MDLEESGRVQVGLCPAGNPLGGQPDADGRVGLKPDPQPDLRKAGQGFCRSGRGWVGPHAFDCPQVGAIFDSAGDLAIIRSLCGGVAQLGERRVRNAEVVSSILILSTT